MAAAKKKESPPEEEENAKGGAEGEAEAGEGVDLPKKKISGKKMVLILAVLLLLLGGGGAAAYFMGYFSHEDKHAEEEAAKAAEEANAPPAYYDMPAILVNLTSTGRRPAYAKIRVQLLLSKDEDREKVTAAQPRIVDSFQTYLRELTVDELQGSAGLLRLREELLLRVNAAVAPVVVKDVLFQEILPQ